MSTTSLAQVASAAVADSTIAGFATTSVMVWFGVCIVIGILAYWHARHVSTQQRLRAQALASMRDAEQAESERQMNQQMSTRKVVQLALPDCTTYSGDTAFLKGVLPDEYMTKIKHVVVYTGTKAEMKPELAGCLTMCYEEGLVRGPKTMSFLSGRAEMAPGERLFIILTVDLRDGAEPTSFIPWCYLP